MANPRPYLLRAPASYSFPKGGPPPIDWSRTRRRLTDARNYWIGSASLGGTPHTTPVWGVWIHDALYLDGHPLTRWSRNITENPAISVHLESAEDVVIVEARVHDLDVVDQELSNRIVAAWDAKYARLHPDPANRGILCAQPIRARAWTTATLADGTGWRFSEDRTAGQHETPGHE